MTEPNMCLKKEKNLQTTNSTSQALKEPGWPYREWEDSRRWATGKSQTAEWSSGQLWILSGRKQETQRLTDRQQKITPPRGQAQGVASDGQRVRSGPKMMSD